MVYAGTLTTNVLHFARRLREAQLLIGPQEVSLGLAALAAVDVSRREDVKAALRTVFATTPLEQRLFDQQFATYWGGGLLTPEETGATLNAPPQPRAPQSLSVLDWDQGAASDEVVDAFAYSAQAVQSSEDGAVQTSQVETLARIVRSLARSLATKPSRRWASTSRRGELTDLRRTIRHSLARGGELLELRYKRRTLGKTRTVFVFDVSGSMMVYSHFLLQLAYAFVREKHFGTAEVFGFSTELYRLSEHLRRGGVAEAIRAARLAMPGRSGGTKVGACLAALLEHHSSLIDSKTVVIINSDGWDTGDLDTLRGAMRTLKERANRVIWLNPLAGSPGYEPTASGMQTALPYIDIFAPSHNLASLEALSRRLARGRA